MRFCFELTVFGVMASIAFAVVFGIAWAVGSPFGLGVGNAAILAALALCFWFPAFANVHIAISDQSEKRRARISAGIRSFGMLMCSAVLTAPIVATGLSLEAGIALFVFGSVCWWGSFIFDQVYA